MAGASDRGYSFVAEAIPLVVEATPLVEGMRNLERNRSHVGQDTGVPVTFIQISPASYGSQNLPKTCHQLGTLITFP